RRRSNASRGKKAASKPGPWNVIEPRLFSQDTPRRKTDACRGLFPRPLPSKRMHSPGASACQIASRADKSRGSARALLLRPISAVQHLLALGTGGDHMNGHLELFFDKGDIVFAVFRQLIPFGYAAHVAFPAGQHR